MATQSNDEPEFPGTRTLTKIVDSITSPFRNFWPGGKHTPVWEDSNEYDFTHKRRGTMVVFNNEYFQTHSSRPGSHMDAENLRLGFTRLRFTVHVHNNQTRDQMLAILKKASKQDYGDSDCFACAVLSHGDEVHIVDRAQPDRYEKEDLVYATDQVILTKELVTMFTDTKCPSLQGKPRLFFIQACRGNRLDEGVDMNVAVDEVDASMADKYEVSPCPIYKDFLVMYATPPGHYAFRRPDTGSWFISGLCEVLNGSHARLAKLTKLLTAVVRLVSQEYESRSDNLKISGKKQSPCFSSMLVKDVYFRLNNPDSPTMLPGGDNS